MSNRVFELGQYVIFEADRFPAGWFPPTDIKYPPDKSLGRIRRVYIVSDYMVEFPPGGPAQPIPGYLLRRMTPLETLARCTEIQ